MIKLARIVWIYLACLYAMAGCIVVPTIPVDPHQKAIDLLQSNNATRESLTNIIGPPDFILGESSSVWIASKSNAFVISPYGGGAVGERDFFLTVDFDDSGGVIQHEVYVDSGSHDYCLSNGICFTAKTGGIPLAPVSWELESKKFDSDSGECGVYIYRDSDGAYKASDDYVHLTLSSSFADYTDDKAQYLSLSAASVPGGYSYWRLPAPVFITVKADYDWLSGNGTGFFTGHQSDSKRQPNVTYFKCDKNDMKYVRIFVPSSSRKPAEFSVVATEQAQQTIVHLKLVLEYAW